MGIKAIAMARVEGHLNLIVVGTTDSDEINEPITVNVGWNERVEGKRGSGCTRDFEGFGRMIPDISGNGVVAAVDRD